MISEIPPTDTGLETVVTGRLAQIGLKRFPVGGPTRRDFTDAADQLHRLGCDSLVDKPFGILSQGERQQVLIARARMAEPLLMVLDEPCAGMDPGVREHFLAWLNERLAPALPREADLSSSGDTGHVGSPADESASGPLLPMPTVVLVTHHVEEIVPGIQNTLVLTGGRTHSLGPTHEVVTRETIENVYDTRLCRLESCGGRLWPIWGD
jgi:iron complex transport system ATP-binding protein